MKTAEVVHLFAKNCIGECDHLPHGACSACLVTTLTAYAEDRVKDRDVEWSVKLHDAQMAGRAEALEEAAKIAEQNSEIDKGFGAGCDCAKHIRALKSLDK